MNIRLLLLASLLIALSLTLVRIQSHSVFATQITQPYLVAPTSAIPLTDVVQVVSGESHTCALIKSGGVKCWGQNDSGQLGDGSINDSSFPVDVFGLQSGIISITVGAKHSCALTNSNSIKCWGLNDYGQVGNGTDNKLIPVDVNGINSDVEVVSAGGLHTCALTNEGGVKCWGFNSNGQLGNGSSNPGGNTPVDVVNLSNGVNAISTGYSHSCAISSTKGVKCWGYNISKQVGNSSLGKVLTPTDVANLTSGVRRITAGFAHTCALTDAGAIKCWGQNTYGQLGNNGNGISGTPVDVAINDANDISASSGLIQGRHTCTVTINGNAKCWGDNVFGQLGNGNTTSSRIPVDVSSLDNSVIAISTGSKHTCALTNSGGVKCWGNNSYGQLGNGTTISNIVPSDVLIQISPTPTPTDTSTLIPPSPTFTLTSTPTPTNTLVTPSSTPTSTPTISGSETYTWVILIYLNGDNDLDDWTFKLFNELEKAADQQPSLNIRVLWDRIGVTNTVLYDVQPDSRNDALANYTEGVTKWSEGERDMGSPETLRNFISSTLQEFPLKDYQSLLAIVDHGGGWSPELLSPLASRGRYDAGASSGFSWDWSNGYSYLSTKDMASVFSDLLPQGENFDIIYYDACLMAMVEEAYQLNGSSKYFVASQYETWTSFPYVNYLVGIEKRSAKEQARWMVDKYFESLSGIYLPHTMSVIDLKYTNALTTAVNSLAVVLDGKRSSLKTEILNAFTQTQKLDYDYDLILRNAEGYVDLGDLALHLKDLPDSDIQSAAQSVLDSLNNYVFYSRNASGDVSSYIDVEYTSTLVNLTDASGISIYLPLGEDDGKNNSELLFYRGSDIGFAGATYWDEFIRDFKGILQSQAPGQNDVGGRGEGSKPKPQEPKYSVYLPAVRR